MMRITVRTPDIAATAVLADCPTAEAIWSALPIVALAHRWGKEIYFEIPVWLDPAHDAREVLEPGELGYWPDGHAFCIFWGPTPASRDTEIRAYSPVNPFGRLEGDPLVFDPVLSGTEIRVERAET
jgi:uncharacterized protein